MTEKSNEKALKIVEQQYASFINLQDNWDFFRGLAEYTKTVQEMAQTKPLIEALEIQRKMARKTYELMNTEAMKELAKSAKRLTSIAESVLKQYEPLIKQTEEVAKKYEPVIKAVQEVHDRMAGRVLSSNPLYAFNSDLFDVARHLRASGHEEAVKEFENNKKRNHNIYGNYTFSPIYEKKDDEERRVERKEQVEPWGAWHQLPIVKRLVFEPDEMRVEFKAEVDKDHSLHFTWLNFLGVAGEMERVRKGKISDNDIVFFRVKDFRSYAQRVHSFIATELLKTDTEEAKLDFDDKQSILYFNGKTITISKGAENDAHELLRTVFKNKSKVWSKDEVLDDWHLEVGNITPKNKVYHAGKAVNRIVAQETQIKDFLVVSTKTITINKKYLKN